MITLLLLVRATYMYGVVLHAHPVRGESHNQRNTTGEVATVCYNMCLVLFYFVQKYALCIRVPQKMLSGSWFTRPCSMFIYTVQISANRERDCTTSNSMRMHWFAMRLCLAHQDMVCADCGSLRSAVLLSSLDYDAQADLCRDAVSDAQSCKTEPASLTRCVMTHWRRLMSQLGNQFLTAPTHRKLYIALQSTPQSISVFPNLLRVEVGICFKVW